MVAVGDAKLVWYRTREGAASDTKMAVYVGDKAYASYVRNSGTAHVNVSNIKVPIIFKLGNLPIVYSHPVSISERQDELYMNDVFAILAGTKGHEFAGNRVDYRALINTGKKSGKFVYVLPVTSVTDTEEWTGYVRTGRRRWLPIPCPRPMAIYNRITLRNLERSDEAVAARTFINDLQIPMFNPQYFDKAEIYKVIANSRAKMYLPETHLSLTRQSLTEMMERHASVYLKPCGGSVGHGMLRIDIRAEDYQVSVLKNGETRVFHAGSFDEAWNLVKAHRLSGKYVIQTAKELMRWQGRPCDFRVLLQKHRERWHVVGIGVRVAGEGVITTHVPNGGSIVGTVDVLQKQFAGQAETIQRELRQAAIAAAMAIDAYYDGKLGEMSMDMAIEETGVIWFLEANSKPMKFDEKNIRQRSLKGVIQHLEELGQVSVTHPTHSPR